MCSYILLHAVCLAAAQGRAISELGFRHRSRLQRRSPLEVRGRLHELHRRARPRLPSAMLPDQYDSPHLVGYLIVWRLKYARPGSSVVRLSALISGAHSSLHDVICSLTALQACH